MINYYFSKKQIQEFLLHFMYYQFGIPMGFSPIVWNFESKKSFFYSILDRTKDEKLRQYYLQILGDILNDSEAISFSYLEMKRNFPEPKPQFEIASPEKLLRFRLHGGLDEYNKRLEEHLETERNRIESDRGHVEIPIHLKKLIEAIENYNITSYVSVPNFKTSNGYPYHQKLYNKPNLVSLFWYCLSKGEFENMEITENFFKDTILEHFGGGDAKNVLQNFNGIGAKNADKDPSRVKSNIEKIIQILREISIYPKALSVAENLLEERKRKK